MLEVRDEANFTNIACFRVLDCPALNGPNSRFGIQHFICASRTSGSLAALSVRTKIEIRPAEDPQMVRETDSGTSFAVSRATRPLAGVALLFAAVVGANAPAAADTIDICRKADGETSQAACSEAIASGKF